MASQANRGIAMLDPLGVNEMLRHGVCSRQSDRRSGFTRGVEFPPAANLRPLPPEDSAPGSGCSLEVRLVSPLGPTVRS